VAKTSSMESMILKAFGYVGKSFNYYSLVKPAKYVVDGLDVGFGCTSWVIEVKKNWFICYANFVTPTGDNFHKILLLYGDIKRHQFNRCHAYYIDEEDLKKNGGSHTDFSLDEIIAALINHALQNNVKTCLGCAGKHPLQTHYIQFL